MKKWKIISFVSMTLVLFLGVAYAAELINGNEVTFSNGASGLKANNVQDAIEELYNKSVNDESCKKVSSPKLSEGLIPVTIENSDPWFDRCGHFSYGVLSGAFSFSRHTGGPYAHDGFRIVLS